MATIGWGVSTQNLATFLGSSQGFASPQNTYRFYGTGGAYVEFYSGLNIIPNSGGVLLSGTTTITKLTLSSGSGPDLVAHFTNTVLSVYDFQQYLATNGAQAAIDHLFGDLIGPDPDTNSFVGFAGSQTLEPYDNGDGMVGGAGNDTFNVGRNTAITDIAYVHGNDAAGTADSDTDTLNFVGAFNGTIHKISNIDTMVFNAAAQVTIEVGAANGYSPWRNSSLVVNAAGAKLIIQQAEASGVAWGGSPRSYPEACTKLDLELRTYSGDFDDSVSFNTSTSVPNVVISTYDGDDTIAVTNDDATHFTINAGAGIDLLRTSVSAVMPVTNVVFNLASPGWAAFGIDQASGIERVELRTVGGNDSLTGGDYDDTLLGGGGGDSLYGGGGSDSLDGDTGDDSLDGSEGSDTLIGGAGHNTINGGNGTDTVFLYDGGTSGAVVNLAASSVDIAGSVYPVSLSTEARAALLSIAGSASFTLGPGATSSQASNNELSGIEIIQTSELADFIFGSDGGETIWSNGGDDWVFGRGGDDSILGGAGDDHLYGGLGLNSHDTIYGGDDDDTIEGGGLSSRLEGNDGNDSIIGSFEADTIVGGSGDDTLLGGGGADSIYGGAGDDLVYANPNPGQRLFGEADEDTVSFGNAVYGVSLQVVDPGTTSVVDYFDSTGNVPVGGAFTTVQGFEIYLGSTGKDFMMATGSTSAVFVGNEGSDTLTGTDTGSDDIVVDYSREQHSGAYQGVVVNLSTQTLRAFPFYFPNPTDFDKAATAAFETILDEGAGGSLNSFLMRDTFGTRDSNPINGLISHIIGSAKADFMLGSDYLGEHFEGRAGNDWLFGGGSDDQLEGGTGDDMLVGGNGSDTLDGGADTDTVAYTGRTQGFTIALDINGDGVAKIGVTTEDTLIGIENLTGGNGNDSLTGNGGANILKGGTGSDTIDGSGGSSDTAVFAGRWSDYAISVNAGTYSFVKGVDTDLVSNVETITFDDGSFAIAATINVGPVGVNDVSGSPLVVEDANDTTSGNVITNDTDANLATIGLGEVLSVTQFRTGAKAAGGTFTTSAGSSLQGIYGTLTINANGTYSYVLDNADADTQSLQAGATASDVFTYRVRDAHNATDTAQLSISVSGAGDTPVISSNGGGATASITINENTTSVTSVVASDVDSAVTYSVSGTDATKFNINAATGALTFKAAPDREAPTDADHNNIYQVTVIASDGTRTDTQALSITVANVNEAPVISSNGGGASASISVNENATAVTTVAASDVDSAVSYSLAGTDAAKFNINTSTGALTFKVAPDRETPADADHNNIYQVTVTASDGALSDTQALSITVANVNEAPVITSNGGGGVASIGVNENTIVVTTVVATDVDSTITYSVSGTDAGLFNINGASGALTFKAAPNRETPTDADHNNIYQVTVTASDGALSDTQTLSISVANVNEAPVISSNGGGAAASIGVSENGTAVTTVVATDVDSTITYSVSGTDSSLFNINTSTGLLTFKVAPNREAPTDADHNNIYQVTVTASDGVLSDAQPLSITVGNVNEGPAVTSNGGGDTAAITVSENTKAVTTVTSSDTDGPAPTFSLSGTDAAKFSINAATGALVFVAAPDFEAAADTGRNNVYDVVVTVSDGALTDSQTLAVTVADVNGKSIAGDSKANTIDASHPFKGRAPTGEEDKVDGKGGNDTIKSGGGDDTLIGGTGKDVLTGGAGADKFVFNTALGASTVDTIKDFVHDTDMLQLDDKIFSKIGASLSKGEFYAKAGAAKAHDKDDRIVYDTKSGKLFYDDDGTGSHAAVHFATLSTKPLIDHGDFGII